MEHRDGFLAAIRAGDRRRAFAVIAEARENGLDVAAIYMEVLQPALREIGRLWQTNELSVAEEHLATAITQLVMARLYSEVVAQAMPSTHTIVAACADTERHELGLRMVCDLLEQQGWDATFLGATVPRASLLTLVQARRPDVVALSASITPHLPQLAATIADVRAASGSQSPFILVGGRPFLDDPSLAARVGADASAADAVTAISVLRERFG